MEDDTISCEDPSTLWKGAALFCALLILAIPSVSAIDINKAEEIGGYFKPSVKSSYSYKWHYKVWENYCPGCHRYNTLAINPKGVPESELTCLRCSADFDGCTGRDKAWKPRWYLTPHIATKEKVKPVVVKKPRVLNVPYMGKNITININDTINIETIGTAITKHAFVT